MRIAAAVLAALGLACGTGTLEGTRDDFVDTWIVNGTLTVTIGEGLSATVRSESFERRIYIEAGATSDEIVVPLFSGCELEATVVYSNATLQPGQSCEEPSSGVVLAFDSGSLSRSGDTATMSGFGKATVSMEGYDLGEYEEDEQGPMEGTALGGTFQLSGNLRRLYPRKPAVSAEPPDAGVAPDASEAPADAGVPDAGGPGDAG